ncbi:hypothetical protein DFQ27_008530 [Actinomortierella ambigua]|uniref:Elongation factor P n=1 Tax=Actinomortierella ambigua TaxID=1343610 RepID=A0A9P6QK67_9FUNG|nr:hypothetical protein DFQ26_007367 [Actinomortierella ambigua]KAG0267629.1 hypothetical protein DFQ27_008530 [Actinomortierella ambigua]
MFASRMVKGMPLQQLRAASNALLNVKHRQGVVASAWVAAAQRQWGMDQRGYKTNVLQVRKGYVVEVNNVLSVVLKRESSVMGRGTSTVKLDLQDLLTGTKHTERYRSVTELEDIKVNFLYRADGMIHLVNPETMDMYEVPESVMEERQLPMLLEDVDMRLSMFQPDPDKLGTPISIRLPGQVNLTIKECHASAAQANKGTTFKNADLENGLRVQVPDFVHPGDKVVVDTETLKYVRRA